MLSCKTILYLVSHILYLTKNRPSYCVSTRGEKSRFHSFLSLYPYRRVSGVSSSLPDALSSPSPTRASSRRPRLSIGSDGITLSVHRDMKLFIDCTTEYSGLSSHPMSNRWKCSKRLPCPARDGGAVSLLTEGAGCPPSDPAKPGHLPHLAYAKQGRLGKSA